MRAEVLLVLVAHRTVKCIIPNSSFVCALSSLWSGSSTMNQGVATKKLYFSIPNLQRFLELFICRRTEWKYIPSPLWERFFFCSHWYWNFQQTKTRHEHIELGCSKFYLNALKDLMKCLPAVLEFSTLCGPDKRGLLPPAERLRCHPNTRYELCERYFGFSLQQHKSIINLK